MKQVLNQRNARKEALKHLQSIELKPGNPHIFTQDREGIRTIDVNAERINFKTLKEAKKFYKIDSDDEIIVMQLCVNPGDREYYDSLKE